jgi:hypothetical protein
MTRAKNNCNSKGGFYWVYNDNNINLKELAGRVNTIFGIRTKNQQEVANFYNDCDYKGFANGLEVGDYDLSRLQSLGIDNDVLSSLTVAEGFEVTVYDDYNFTGTSKTYRGNVACLVADGLNDKVSSLRIRTTGATTLAGTWFIQNRNSGKYMDLAAEHAQENGGNIQQWEYVGGTNQQFQLIHLGDGTYNIKVVASGKSVDVSGISKDEGATILQWDYVGGFNQQFVLVPTTDGYYKFIAKHSGRIAEVADASTANGADVRQWGNNNQTCGQWRLVQAGGARTAAPEIIVNADKDFILYPNPVIQRLYFSAREVTGAKVAVSDITGHIVINTVMSGNSIDVSRLKPGFYTVRIFRDGKTSVKKFIKN